MLKTVEDDEEEDRRKGDAMLKKDGKGQKAKKKAEKKEKPKAKPEKKAINWDSDEGETKGGEEEKNKKNMVKKAAKEPKSSTKGKAESSEGEDLISRVKRKMKEQ